MSNRNYSNFTAESAKIMRELRTPCFVINPITCNQKQFVGLWDTGATATSISSNVAEQLGLKLLSQTKINHAGGTSLVNTFLIDLILPNKVKITQVGVTESKLSHGIDLLIGMDIITFGDFAVTNFNNKTCFSFRMPSKEKIDFVKGFEN